MCRKVRQKGNIFGIYLDKTCVTVYCICLAIYKTTSYNYVSVEGNWRYLRSCAWLGEPGVGSAGGYTPDERYCIHRSGTYNIHVEYCTCR